jgi:hypothetical protein
VAFFFTQRFGKGGPGRSESTSAVCREGLHVSWKNPIRRVEMQPAMFSLKPVCLYLSVFTRIQTVLAPQGRNGDAKLDDAAVGLCEMDQDAANSVLPGQDYCATRPLFHIAIPVMDRVPMEV